MCSVLEIMAFEFVSKLQWRTAIKNLENVFCLRDNGVWICIKMCKLQREYLLSAVNDLTNSLKITNQTNKDFFQFNISQIHGKIR